MKAGKKEYVPMVQSDTQADMSTISFGEIAAMIDAAKERAWRAVNAELVKLYWDIGKWLSEKCSAAEWGDKVVEKAAEYLRVNRPDLGSYAKRTLYRMRSFYEAYKDDEFVSPLVTQIGWTQHLIVLTRAKSQEERRFYLEKCISERYSKRDLERQFDASFFQRCFFAFELKTRRFRPSDIGQIDFYLEALDRDVKRSDENPSVGVVLCTDKDDAVVEYALSRSISPTMVATYETVLPDKHLLESRLRQITDLVMEASGVTELPDDEGEDVEVAK